MSDYIMNLRKLVGSRPLLAAGACVIFIDEQGKILLMHRTDNDMWGFPGGTTDLGETLEETARREAFEEVGLICNNLELMNIYSGPELYYKYPNGDEVHNVSVAYICRDYSGQLSIDPNEVKEARFFDVQEIPSQISPPNLVVVNDVLKLQT